MSRRGCKPNWRVVQNKKSGDCAIFAQNEAKVSELKGKSYTNIAEIVDEKDAALLAECKNQNWDADFIAYLQLYRLLNKETNKQKPTKAEMKKLLNTVDKLNEEQMQPPQFSCIGRCDSINRSPRCDECYQMQNRIWTVCAYTTILKELTNREEK